MDQRRMRDPIPVPDGKTYPRKGIYADKQVYIVAIGSKNTRICPIEGTNRQSFLVDTDDMVGITRPEYFGKHVDVLAVQRWGRFEARRNLAKEGNRACKRRRNMKFSKMCDYKGEAHFVCKTGTKNVRILAVGQSYDQSFVVPIGHTTNRRPAEFHENADSPLDTSEEIDDLELIPQ